MKKTFLKINKLDHPKITYGFFTRLGGFSNDAYESLNCSYTNGDNYLNVKKRKILVDYYKKRISHLKPYIKAIKSYEFCFPAWHLFVVLIDFKKIKINKIVFAKKLLSAGIGSQVHL